VIAETLASYTRDNRWVRGIPSLVHVEGVAYKQPAWWVRGLDETKLYFEFWEAWQARCARDR